MFRVWELLGRTYGFAMQNRADIECNNKHGVCGRV